MSNQSGPLELELADCCSPLTADPLSADQAELLARRFKALGDPVRLRLLSLIASHAGGEACVCELTLSFDVSEPTISHHLKVLRESGLIDGDRRAHLGLLPGSARALTGPSICSRRLQPSHGGRCEQTPLSAAAARRAARHRVAGHGRRRVRASSRSLLSPSDVGLQLLENSLTTVLGLAV